MDVVVRGRILEQVSATELVNELDEQMDSPLSFARPRADSTGLEADSGRSNAWA